MRLNRIEIRDFKRISSISIDLEDVTLLVGGNNSGKSSVLQAIHFAVASLRAAKQHGKSASQPATTLATNQFNYRPSNDLMGLRYRSPMTQQSGPNITFHFEDSDGDTKKYSLSLYRGKNANIQLLYASGTPFFKAASSLTKPFSIFVPGLAGLSLQEELRSNSIINSGIAQGDANLYLRNVLHRLCNDSTKLSRFHSMIDPIFPGIRISSSFDENIDQFIKTDLRNGLQSVPIELGGTGALQAIQLAAYVTLYEPALLLLDEPDAHLHPGNQKQLVDLVFDITQTTSTQVVMASHSRHVLDRVGGNPSGQIVWIKDGVKQESSEADLPLLMDIGALDEFEELSKNRVKRLIFCEDTKIERLRYLVESSGVDPDAVHFVSFNGIDNLTAAGTVVEFFLRLGPDRKAVVYRDGDCMTANEKAWLKGKAEKELPNNAHLYISRYTDIEHGLCDPNHVAECLNIGAEEAGEIVGSVVEKYQARLASKATAKRSDLKAKVLRDCTERDSTEKLFADGISFEYALGKILLPRLREELADRGMDASQLDQTSSSLADGELAALLR